MGQTQGVGSGIANRLSLGGARNRRETALERETWFGHPTSLLVSSPSRGACLRGGARAFRNSSTGSVSSPGAALSTSGANSIGSRRWSEIRMALLSAIISQIPILTTVRSGVAIAPVAGERCPSIASCGSDLGRRPGVFAPRILCLEIKVDPHRNEVHDILPGHFDQDEPGYRVVAMTVGRHEVERYRQKTVKWSQLAVRARSGSAHRRMFGYFASSSSGTRAGD